jgi:hypothetical protein
LADNRTAYKAKFADLKNKDLTKKLGEGWSSLDASAKEPYMAKAKELSTEWKGKMEEYKKTPEFKAFQIKKMAHAATQKPKGTTKRKVKAPKDPNAPKRPSTGFFLYVADKRAEVKATLPLEDRNKVTLITKKLGKMWKEGGVDLQNEYKARSTKKKEAYNVVFAEYKTTPEYAQHQENLKNFKEAQRLAQSPRKPVVRGGRAPPRYIRHDESDSDSESSTSSSS